MDLKSVEELFAAIGYGHHLPDHVLVHLVSKEELEAKKAGAEADPKDSFLKKVFRTSSKKSEIRNSIIVANLDDVLIRLARCCNPLPGDSIIGFITRGRGVTIHAASCPKAHEPDTERRVNVKWNVKNSKEFKHHAKIRVLAQDEPGILATMSQTISGFNINIASVNIRTTKDRKAVCLFDVEVSDTSQLDKVISALEAKKGVISVERSLA